MGIYSGCWARPKGRLLSQPLPKASGTIGSLPVDRDPTVDDGATGLAGSTGEAVNLVLSRYLSNLTGLVWIINLSGRAEMDDAKIS